MTTHLVPFNPMRHINFSLSKLKKVYFIDPIDLSGCRFPDSVILVNDNSKVFIEVAKRIKDERISPDKEMGLKSAASDADARKRPLGQVVINRYVKEELYGKEFAKKYFDFVKEVLEQYEVN